MVPGDQWGARDETTQRQGDDEAQDHQTDGHGRLGVGEPVAEARSSTGLKNESRAPRDVMLQGFDEKRCNVDRRALGFRRAMAWTR